MLLHGLVDELHAFIGEGAALVEFGCGASIKTRILLNRLREIALYVPVDICEESLAESTRSIRAEFPHLTVEPLAGDFLAPTLGEADRILDAIGVVGIPDSQDVPSVAEKSRSHILSEGDAGAALNSDVIVVVDPTEIVEIEVRRQRGRF